MSRVYADTIEPRKPTQDITLGTTGETITLPGNDLRVNTVKDKGGNTLWTSDGSGTLSSVNAGLKGNLNLLSTQTPSGVSSVSFTSGIDSTYDVYMFTFVDIGVSTDSHFSFQVSTNGCSSYGVNKTITSTYFKAYHAENGSASALTYDSGEDQAQGTAYQNLANSVGSESDECAVGQLYLFAPSNTTYVKHFYTVGQYLHASDYSQNHFCAGYFNVTGAITQLSFKFNSGNFDGVIKMYGL